MDEQDPKQNNPHDQEESIRPDEEQGQTTTRRIRRTPWGRPRSSDRKERRPRP